MRKVKRLVDNERSIDSARHLESAHYALPYWPQKGYELMQDGLAGIHYLNCANEPSWLVRGKEGVNGSERHNVGSRRTSYCSTLLLLTLSSALGQTAYGTTATGL